MPEPLLNGTTLQNGDFIIQSKLGQGGFGITYKAEQSVLKRVVAIKEFYPKDCSRDPNRIIPGEDWTETLIKDFRLNFIREARRLASVNHSGVVQVYTLFEENATAYIVMEYLQGVTLKKKMESVDGGLPIEEAKHYILQICHALEAVHQQTIIHRDLKPDNIMCLPNGGVKVIDFGSAREFHPGEQRLTSILTPGYAPCEQYDDFGDYGPPTDLYALAATFYHLITGERPINSLKRRNGTPMRMAHEIRPEIPLFLSEAISAGLEVESHRRPQTVREFLQMLEEPIPTQLIIGPTLNVCEEAEQEPQSNTKAPKSQKSNEKKKIRLELVHNITTYGCPIVALEWNRRDGSLLMGSIDGYLRIWDGDKTRATHANSGDVQAITWCPEGRRFFSHGRPEGLQLRDGDSGLVLKSYPTFHKLLTGLAWGGNWLAAGRVDGILTLMDITDDNPTQHHALHDGAITGVVWNPQSNLFATCGEDGTLYVFSPEAQGSTRPLLKDLDPIAALAWSPDGAMLATGEYDRTHINIWNVETATLYDEVIQHDAVLTAVRAMHWSAKHDLLAYGNADGTIGIYCPRTRSLLYTEEAHHTPIRALDWNHTGTHLATVGEEGNVRIWAFTAE